MIADWEINGVLLPDKLKYRHADLFAQLHSRLVSHGVEVRLLHDVCDIWARDYCPIQVGPQKFVKFRYTPDYLRNDPQLRTGDEVVKEYKALGDCLHSAIVLDGGNVVASRTKAILTDKVYKENPDWTRPDLRKELQRLLQVEQLIVIPKEPYEPIGHSDAMVRFIDENTVLVNDYGEVDPAFGERLLKTLRKHGLSIELIPYCPEQRSTDGIPSAVGCFTNFLRTEKVLIAPVYGTRIEHVVLKKLKSIFLAIPVVYHDCTDLAREGGILNCISTSYCSPQTSDR
jgi:agmatine deiminase